jgi:hypothetical protein
VYRNDSTAPRVAVRLKGHPPNTRGIGARVKLLGGPVTQSQVMECGGRYVSCDEAVRAFAASPATGGLTLEVTWRNGAVSVLNDVRPNRVYEIAEAGARPPAAGPRFQPAPLFTDVSHLLQHAHADREFNDFERQPLLPRKLSQLGPGVSWADVDGDGWDDLVIGSGAGGTLAVHRNDGRGAFQRWQGPPFDQAESRDQTTVLGWRKADGQTSLLAGSSSYEDAATNLSVVRQYDLTRRRVVEDFPGGEASPGPLAMADVDGDGVLDLFVGGRVAPREYPTPVSSLLFRGGGAKFARAEENCRRLAGVGLTSGAVFSDLDGDGWPDLVLACEWGPLRIFRNERGRLAPWDWPVTGLTPQLSTLSRLTGWWNGVTAGDFDGDGRLDLAASNWGRNTKYQWRREQPLRIYYGRWRIPEVVDQMEGYYDPALKKVVPWCTYEVARAMPWLAERFPTYGAFGKVSVAELLGERLQTTKTLTASWLETTLFLNRGDRFEARVLPVEAQLAPAFGLGVGDLDGDGNEDLFLSQNFFALDGDTSRYDAGRGLLLVGDGQGNFRAVPGQESGVKVYGEQRGCAVGDYDADGRADLVVTQNGAATKLYRNTGARPGLRVRLAGPAGNPWGVGAGLRLRFGAKEGPLREIHAGSGYWSQDSVAQVLATPEPPTGLWVRWPGGKTTHTPLPPGVREITVDSAGSLKPSR